MNRPADPVQGDPVPCGQSLDAAPSANGDLCDRRAGGASDLQRLNDETKFIGARRGKRVQLQIFKEMINIMAWTGKLCGRSEGRTSTQQLSAAIIIGVTTPQEHRAAA
jgi:hypothetical protein